jgi:CubicO group peptidase (beta-lactamase class C family)
MTNYIGYCFVLILLISCDSQSVTDKETDIATQSFSNHYQPPLFDNDLRIQKIEALTPEIQQVFEEHALARKIPGIAYGIVVDDSLVIASSIGLINLAKEHSSSIKSSFRIASMTKSFTAMAILKLRDEGRLSLEDPVSKYIPAMTNLEYLTSDSPIINIRNLLTMTAGFPEDNPWGDRQLDESDQMLLSLVEDGISFSNVPSSKFEYSNTGYALLGNIVSRVSGIPYQDYIREQILQPLGMNQTYWEYVNVPPDNLALGYRWEDGSWILEPMLHHGSYGSIGGLITSIEDFSKYVSFHLSAWPARSEEENGPVKRSSLREMQTAQFSSLEFRERNYNGDLCSTISGYGYGLSISKDCKWIKRVGHGGALPGFGSNYTFYPDYGVGIMAFGNLTYTRPLPSDKIEKLLFETALTNPRRLPVSDILAKRQEQVLKFIQTWDPELEKEIVAENLYMDESREKRMGQVQKIFEKAGIIKEVDKIEPWNQLRGTFKIHAEHGVIVVYFALNPEKSSTVQDLYITFEQNQIEQ